MYITELKTHQHNIVGVVPERGVSGLPTSTTSLQTLHTLQNQKTMQHFLISQDFLSRNNLLSKPVANRPR